MTKRILLIDNDEWMRIFFRDIFWIHGSGDKKYEIIAAESLEKAQTCLADIANKPDIIFLDISMSIRSADGSSFKGTQPALNFIQDIRHNSEFVHTPIIVFSTFTEQGIKEKVKEAGADHYLIKGQYMPKEMIEFVDKL